MVFKEISPFDVNGNTFDMVGRQWALLTAGDEKSCNTMTISWGGLGILWNKPSATVYIRPQRYTHEFVEREDHFTLSFFGGAQREALMLLGTKSGRDGDKIAEAGLTVQMLGGQPAFEQADVVLVCRKVYRQQMEEENILDKPAGEEMYPGKDFHTIYVGHIEKVFVKK